MGRLVHEDLGMSSFTLQKRQTFSKAAKQKKLSQKKTLSKAAKQKKKLLNELKRGTAGETVWSDEKIFTIEQAHSRNDRVIGRKVSDIPYERKTVYRRMKPASIMVWAAISKIWKSPLIFVEENS